MITATAALLHLFLMNWIQQDSFLRFGREEWTATKSIEKSWSVRLPLLMGALAIAAILLNFAPGQWTARIFHLEVKEAWLAMGFMLSMAVTVEIQTLLQITGRMTRLAFIPAWISVSTATYYAVLFALSLQAYRMGLSLLGTILITLLECKYK